MMRVVLIAVCALALSACATRYTTPGGPVSLAAIDSQAIATAYSRQPASPFPANIALIRLQDYGYQSYTNVGHNLGSYSVVSERDIESDDALENIETLPLVADVAHVSRILLPPGATSIDELRRPAAQLRADLLLIYSVDTKFFLGGSALGPFSVFTLGLLPDQKARVNATVSGVLVDVRTGYVYGVAEATAQEEQNTNAWRSRDVTDRVRLAAETAAFTEFTDEFRLLWRDVTNQQAARPPAAAPAEPSAPAGASPAPLREYHVLKFPPGR
ncbi:MAG: hypothetical protein R3358_14375 [Woeseiaceae bacterium]|nr:hypothetical protein [Woeseiaceae bacterium]